MKLCLCVCVHACACGVCECIMYTTPVRHQAINLTCTTVSCKTSFYGHGGGLGSSCLIIGPSPFSLAK